MSFKRWFNRLIDPVPLTLTLLVGGLVVWPSVLVAMAWAGLWVLMAPGLIIPGLR